MKFYFPDSQDMVSPTYDFMHDEYSPLRVRQRDDRYAHEVLDGARLRRHPGQQGDRRWSIKGVGKYSHATAAAPVPPRSSRLFRLPNDVETLGDCGAFNYVERT